MDIRVGFEGGGADHLVLGQYSDTGGEWDFDVAHRDIVHISLLH